MNTPDSVVQAHLRKVDERWKYRKMWMLGALALSVFSLLMLLLGIAMWRGWITTPAIAVLLAVLLVLAAGLAACWIPLDVLWRQLELPWLAGASEVTNPRFLDRLNTLAYFGARRDQPALQPYLVRVRAQAAELLTQETPLPFSPLLAWLSVAFATALLAGTIWFYAQWQPWRHLAAKPLLAALAKPETNFELAAATVAKAQAAKPWGEVRITEPARDLKLTKVDVLALKIEAAANQDLHGVTWTHAVNGGEPGRHPLDEPKEASYAAYDPIFYLDELRLSDWDLVSYYAEASAGPGQVSSEIYFIEIRPFRSEIAKMPGGEGGAANQALNEVSALIERQQKILRETRRFLGANYADEKVKTQDRGKLAAAESSLRESSDALYAKVAVQLENQPVGDVLEALANGAESMGKASTALHDDAVLSGQQHELAALQFLVASRKNLQKFITDHPSAFEPKNEPTADPLLALAEVTEFRDQQKAARKGIDQLLEEQKKLRNQVSEASEMERKKFEPQQQELGEKLKTLEKQQPDLFRGVEEQRKAAAEAMRKAAAALRNKESEEYRQNRAVDRLEDLQQALGKRDGTRELEQAYRMKKLLEQEAQQMRQAAQGKLSNEQTQKLIQAAEQTTGELKKFSEESAAGFGTALEESLSEGRQEELQKQLDEAAGAGSAEERKAAAEKASESLQGIADAFEQSVPRGEGQGGSGTSAGNDPLTRALQELQSLIQRGKDGRPATSEDEAKQRAEALANLQAGLLIYSKEPASVALLMQAEQELKATNRPVNIEVLKKLLDEIENFRVELSERTERAALKAEVTHADSTRISPIYRNRVQEYYRKLSEK